MVFIYIQGLLLLFGFFFLYVCFIYRKCHIGKFFKLKHKDLIFPQTPTTTAAIGAFYECERELWELGWSYADHSLFKNQTYKIKCIKYKTLQNSFLHGADITDFLTVSECGTTFQICSIKKKKSRKPTCHWIISSYKCAVKGSPKITLICFKHFSYWLFSFTDSCTARFRSSISWKNS